MATFLYQDSVVGSVIQATGTVEIEEALWLGNQLEVWNQLHYTWESTRGSVHTKIPPGAD